MSRFRTYLLGPGLLCGVSAFLLTSGVLLGAATATTTQTALQVSNQSTSFGTVYTLLATVSVDGALPVFPGQVIFEDEGTPGASTPGTGTPKGCHLLETAQLTGTGQAKLVIRLGVGPHSLLARFLGTKSYVVSMQSYAPSVSGDTSVSVTGTPAVTITFAGSAGSYTLNGTVTNNGFLTPAGNVKFIDQTNGGSPLGTAALGSGTLTQTFAAQQSNAVGSQPRSVAVGDFNGDGIPDLVTANSGGNTVRVLLGQGDGTFQPQQTYAVGGFPWSVAVGDFNGDGIPDLVSANFGDGTVSVLLGNGGGTFQPQQTYKVAGQPTSVAIGDFNGDGSPDLVTANGADNTVSVLLNQGDGTFQPAQTYAVGSQAQSVAVGDFNGDGIPDLVTANFYDNTVSVLMGIGDGTFQPQQAYKVGLSPFSVGVGDFNGDGVPDLATANFNDNTVSVLLNQVQQTATATLSNVSVFGGGTHNIAAQCSGDSYFAKTTSSTTVALTGSLISTGLTLTANPNSGVTTAQPVTLTAMLSPVAAYNYTATGSVTFYDNGAPLSTGVLVNGGAMLRTTLPAGNNTLTAIYSGDINFGSSNSNSVALTVTQAASFTIAAEPPSETAYRGRLAGFLLKLTSVNGFQGNVQLSCSGGPSGSQCADLPQTVYLNGVAYALSGILFPKKTAPGTYSVTFTGTSGSLTASATATFTVR